MLGIKQVGPNSTTQQSGDQEAKQETLHSKRKIDCESDAIVKDDGKQGIDVFISTFHERSQTHAPKENKYITEGYGQRVPDEKIDSPV